MLAKDTGGGDFEQAPAGSHIARCIKLIDIGTQEKTYQGKTELKRQIVVMWELPGALMTKGESAGKPFTISKFYRLSLSEKANLRADLRNWRGRDFTKEELDGFQMKNILDKCCMLSITHVEKKGKMKAEVSAVMGLPHGINPPVRVNDLVFFSLDENEFSRQDYDKLSDGYKKMINASPEWAVINGKQAPQPAAAASQAPDDNFDDDIPF